MTMNSIARCCTIFIVAALASAQAGAAEISGELIAKAKQEGEVVYYTDLIVDQIVRPLAGAFEAKYGIKVSYARADSQVNILKMLNEQKAGRVMSDIFGLNTGLEVLIAAGAARQFTTANGEELPARPDVPPLVPDLIPETGGFTGNVITPAITAKSYDHWNDVYNDLFR